MRKARSTHRARDRIEGRGRCNRPRPSRFRQCTAERPDQKDNDRSSALVVLPHFNVRFVPQGQLSRARLPGGSRFCQSDGGMHLRRSFWIHVQQHLVRFECSRTLREALPSQTERYTVSFPSHPSHLHALRFSLTPQSPNCSAVGPNRWAGTYETDLFCAQRFWR